MSATIDILADRHDRPAVLRAVEFVCPLCGDDRSGTHVTDATGTDWVECDTCSYRCDAGVLEIPTQAMLASWYAQALRHGREALRCADWTPAGSYLATVWCRRLAPELSPWGKTAFLDAVARPLTGSLTPAHRQVIIDLGIALQMPAATINDVLDAN